MKEKAKLISSIILTILFTYYVVFANRAVALQESVPFAEDSRLRMYVYDPFEIYSFTGFYGFHSSIDFELGESISNITMGNPLSWQLIPQGSRMFLKPVEPDAETMMTILTDRRIYYFELYAEDPEGDIRNKDYVLSARFAYPKNDANFANGTLMELGVEQKDETQVPNYHQNPSGYNFNYTVSGSRQISPVQVFDDGEFTYLEFRNKNSEIPAIFQVDEYGKESLINYRIEGDFVIIERVSSQYTLRMGDVVACLFNETKPLARKKLPLTERFPYKSVFTN